MDLLHRFLEKDPTKRISIDEILVFVNALFHPRLIHGSSRIFRMLIRLHHLVFHEKIYLNRRFVMRCLFELVFEIAVVFHVESSSS